jgi:hypothetical protein
MQRRTALLLLLLALVGTFVPVALAATARPQHACCIRNAHRCYDSAVRPSDQLAIRGAGSCNHDCCRAVTTSQWAHPQARLLAWSFQRVEANVTGSHPTSAATELFRLLSTRAPPSC